MDKTLKIPVDVHRGEDGKNEGTGIAINEEAKGD